MSSVVSTRIYDLLKTIVTENIENYTIDVHDPNKKGQGFLGEICYLTIKNKTSGKEIDLVIKQAFGDVKVRSIYHVRKYYLNEIHFYTKVWSSLKEFQRERGLSRPFDKIPKCFATSTEFDHEKLAFENLRIQNFEIYDKTKPFDDEHLTFILREYGKYHAISFAYKILHPQEYNEISKGLEDIYGVMSNLDTFHDFLTYVYKLALRNLEKEDTKAIEKIKNLVDNGVELFQDKINYRGKYSVILHGDCWCNNMLFKYNEQRQLCDIRLLDFQLSKVGTPVSDISYFLYSGGSKECLDRLDHYLEIYHKSLLGALEEFGLDSADIYPFEQLKSDWKEYCYPGFSLGLLLWRSRLVYDGEVVDMNDMTDGEDTFMAKFEQSKYDRETCKLRSRDLILHVVENGFL